MAYHPALALSQYMNQKNQVLEPVQLDDTYSDTPVEIKIADI